MGQCHELTKAHDGFSVGFVLVGKVGDCSGGLAAKPLSLVGVHGIQEPHQAHQPLPSHLPHLVLAVPATCTQSFQIE